MKFKVMFNFLLKQMYSDRRGTDKNHPGQNLPDKRPSDKRPGQKPPRTIQTEFVQAAFVRVFCTRPNKNRGWSEMWDVLSGGGSRDVWRSVTEGRGCKNWPKIAWHTLWTAPWTCHSPMHVLKWVTMWLECCAKCWKLIFTLFDIII